MSDHLEALRNTALFADVGPQALERLAAKAQPETLAAREWLFRAGDAAEAMWVVCSGSLRAVLEQPELQVLGSMARGDVVGELALLTGAPRSAAVRAQRDSVLLRIEGADFLQVLREEPDFALSLTRVLGRRLQASRAIDLEAPPLPRTIALLRFCDEAPFAALVARLRAEMEQSVSLAVLEAPQGEGVLDDLERSNQQVLLLAQNADLADPWSAYCLRQADRVVLVAGPEAPPRSWTPGPLQGADLAYIRPAAGSGSVVRWCEVLTPRRRHIMRADGGDGAARMARRLCGRAIGVVLSGGGARGFAHLGVLEELLAAGIQIDRVGGTSMGGLVGALFASGRTPAQAAALLRREFIDRNPLNDFTVPLVALTRGLKGRAMVERLFGELRIEELERDYYCVSCDVLSNALVVHREGELIRAVGATTSLPGFVPPVPDGDRLLVDGGVMNNLPADLMPREEGPVIAVNVTDLSHADVRQARWAHRPAIQRAHRRLAGIVEDYEPLSLMETIIRSVVLGSADSNLAAERYADYLIAPDVAGVDLLDWAAMPQMREAGRAATRAALAGQLGGLSSDG